MSEGTEELLKTFLYFKAVNQVNLLLVLRENLFGQSPSWLTVTLTQPGQPLSSSLTCLLAEVSGQLL